MKRTNRIWDFVADDWQSKEWAGGFGQQILGDTWIAHYGKFQQEATLAKIPNSP